MTSKIAILIAACGAGVLGTGAQSTARVRQPCRAPGALVTASSSAAVTLTTARVFHGCARGYPARRLVDDDVLDSAKGGVATGAPTLSGRRAGWVFEYCDRGGCEVSAEIRNLVSGRRVRAGLGGYPALVTVRVLLSSSGVLVFSRRTSSGGEILQLASASGRLTTVAAGPIDPMSLAIAGERAFWLADGRAVSAEL